MVNLLLICIMIILVPNGSTSSAKFSLSTVYDTETRWGPKPGEEYLQSMKIACEQYLDQMPSKSPWSSNTSPKIIHIHNCTLPTTPLAELLKNLSLDITVMDKLILTDCSVPTTIPENYSANIDITKLELTNVTNMTTNFFKSLKYLYKLTVDSMDMPPLVPTPKKASFSRDNGRLLELHLKKATFKNMVNCEFISTLSLDGLTEEQITAWPESCGGMLRTMHLRSMSAEAVQKVGNIRPAFLIESLTVENSTITELPVQLMKGVFGAHRRVFRLNLNNNTLEDKAFLQFKGYIDLRFMDLSYNRLTGECLKYILPNVGGGMQQLESLNFNGNKFTDIFNDYEVKAALVKHHYVRRLTFNGMNLAPDCLRHVTFSWLEYLGLASKSSELIESLQLHNLPSITKAKKLTVDLRGRPVRSVVIGPNFTENFDNLNESEHWLTSKGYTLIVLLDSVDCDCNNDILQRALKKYPNHLFMPGLKCTDGGLFLEEPIEKLSCRKAIVKGCKRRLSRDEDYKTDVECNNIGDKFVWPRAHGLRGLSAQGNGISTLKDAYIPESVEWLDLRNNNISRLSEEEVVLLFGPLKRRLWLSGNPILCECIDRPLIDALHSNHSRVMDYEKIKCPKGRVSEVTVFDICSSGPWNNLPPLQSYRERHAKIRYEKEILCSGSLDNEQSLPKKTTLHKLTLHNCKIPLIALAGILESLNINITSMDSLRLFNITIPPVLPTDYTNGLQINNLELHKIQNLPANFFASLVTLVNLTVEDMKLPQIPSQVPLRILELKNTTVEKWANCYYLKDLTMSGMSEEQISKSWPDNCRELRHLILNNLTPGAVKRFMSIINMPNLLELKIYNSSLVESPLGLLQNSTLYHLDLSYNHLEDHGLLQFPYLSRLRILDLSHNKLTGEFLTAMVPKVPNLQYLTLDSNNFVHTFKNLEIKTAITSLQSLIRLSMNNMVLNADCLMYSRFPYLGYLGLRSNLDKANKTQDRYNLDLKLHGLPGTGASDLTVDLQGMSFISVLIDSKFNEDIESTNTASFWLTTKGYNLEVKLDSVDCDCNNDMLSQTLRDFSRFISMPNLRCNTKNGQLFADEPLERLNCMKATVHGCKRRISRDFDYRTTVDCSYNKEKFKWPRPDKIFRGLNASGNHITSLHNAYLPDSLLWLDLRDNQISYLYGDEPALLFSTSARRVWLSGNPIACHCDNKMLLNALRVNHSQIMDYDELMCADSEQPVRLVSIDELCRFKLEYVWGTGIVLSILALVAALLLRHYWISLRMRLYAHGYCTSCLHEEDVDEDRPFDAFVSFAHGDDEYVMEQLLPGLEGGPSFYRVCVHYRDWALGEWIPAQIMHSVRLSKRTIIVLSKSFVTSWWGAMEFRYAQATALAEGRSRLLVLVLDDVLEENLAPELKTYLGMNTYLRCDDPWFWEKLRYAMPRLKRLKPSQESKVQGRRNQNFQHSSDPMRMETMTSHNPPP